MSSLDQDTALLHQLAEWSGLTPAAIAREAGVAKTTINRPFNGSATTRLSGNTIEKLRKAFPQFPAWVSTVRSTGMPFDHQFDQRSVDLTQGSQDALEIPMLELAYGMGGAFLDGDERGALKRFPAAFVRAFTNAPADKLAFAHGIGDSMFPTIGDRDILLIDRSRDDIRISDQIWVLAVGGIGMVKRVRLDFGSVKLLSDNQTVPEYTVAEDELTIIGRVIAVTRSL
ncbi:MAG: S24 family peptidase [Pseudomonadota bacterium]